ncbi:MAG: exosortase/archaeosortase family protein [Deltaproteobacteria bacterium]|nr:exosortase/archaeosortase family protein [Deltaproteobacteria bacterium]
MTKEQINIFKKVVYLLLAIGITIEIIVIYKDIFLWMKTAWFTYPPDRFGIFIPLLFLFIFLYRFIRNPIKKIKGNRIGFFVIVSGALIFMIGIFADIHIIQAASLIITCYGIVLYLMGSEWGMIMLFPFFFLIFMLPTTSFLIESIFSVPLRSMTAKITCKILNSTGSACETINCILYVFNTELPVQYYRESISSLMMHIILTFIAAEFIFIKNWSKFLYLLLLWAPYIIIAHSVLYLVMGWVYASGSVNQSEIIWAYRKWLPAILHVLMLIFTWAMIRKITGRKDHVSR